MSIKARAEIYCEQKKIRLAAFCRAADISNGYFNQREQIGFKIGVKISKAFPDLNLDWLQTGEGSMLNSSTPIQAAVMTPYPTNNITTGNVTGNGNNFVAGNGNAVQTPVEEVVAEEVSIECIPIAASSVTAVRGVDIQEYVEQNADELEHLDLTKFVKDVDHAEWVTDMSMYPTLKPNDAVIIKWLPEKTVVDGKMYYFNTENWPTMVRIVKIEGDKLRLIAENPNFGDIVINRTDIIRVGKVLCMFRKNFGDYFGEVEAIRRKKDEQIGQLIGHLGDSMIEISKQGARTDRVMEQNAELIKRLLNK